MRWRRLLPEALIVVAVVAVVAVSVGAPRMARAAGFDLDFFKPTTAATGYFSEESGLTLGRGRLDTEVASAYAYRPLVLRDQRTGSINGDVVRDRVMGALAIAYGLTSGIDVGLRFAAVLRQIGIAEVDLVDGGVAQRVRMVGIGDTDVIVRVALVSVNRRERQFRLTLTAPIGIPTGAPDALAGSGKVSFRPRVTAGWHWDTFSAAFSAGFSFRPPVEATSSYLVVGNAVIGGLGLSWTAIPQRLWLLAETSALVGTSLSSTGVGNAATQAMAGPRVLLPASIFLQAGAGTGLNHAAGSPRFAAMATAGRVW